MVNRRFEIFLEYKSNFNIPCSPPADNKRKKYTHMKKINIHNIHCGSLG